MIIAFHLHSKLPLFLVVWIDHLIIHNKKSSPQTAAFIESWIPTLKISLLNTKKLSLQKLFFIDGGPKKANRQQRNVQRQGRRTVGGTVPPPTISRIPLRTPTPSHLRRWPPVSNHCGDTKINSFICSPIWKNRWRNNKPNQIAIGSR